MSEDQSAQEPFAYINIVNGGYIYDVEWIRHPTTLPNGRHALYVALAQPQDGEVEACAKWFDELAARLQDDVEYSNRMLQAARLLRALLKRRKIPC